ncbi:MAG: hypothetical protein QOE22_254 [Candidatus Parcubacteria bacterium]|jgi:uncharacterized membrane protein|nr:hypothetical protein [Candidatus Parcubacteria bacterium]
MEITLTPIISVRECIRFGWNTFKGRPLPFIAAVIVVDGLTFLSEYVSLSLSFENPASIAWFVLSILVVVAVQIVIMTSFTLRAHDNPGTVGLRDLLYAPNGWKLVGASILSLLAVLLGLILLIIPGIIVALALTFSGYLAVEGRRPMAAIKESAALTKGNRFKLFLIGLLMLVSILFSAIFLYWGETASRIAEFIVDLVVLPVVWLAFAHAYRVLQKAKSAEIVQAQPVI